MLGDDTGDNISEKRESFNELTVQYWAWKNVDADYYGLQQYRRYFSFSDYIPKEKTHALLYKEDYLSTKTIHKYDMDNVDKMYETISKYDCIIMKPVDIRKVPTMDGYKKNIKEHWKACNNHLVKYKFIEKMMLYIKEHHGDMYNYAVSYLNSYNHIGYNCFIMKKDIFHNLCSFEFDVLSYLEKYINEDSEFYSETMNRSIGYLGEILFGIYCYYLIKTKIKLQYLNLIFFENTKKYELLLPFSHINNIAIAVRISDYYVPYFAVLLQSIIDNSNDYNNYDILVLENKINKINKNILISMIDKKHNFSIRYIKCEPLLDNINLYISGQYYSREAYYTLFVPWLLPEYQKVLVMDADLILQGDIAEIYNSNIDNYFISACKDVVYAGMINLVDDNKKYAKKTLKLNNIYNYVNTGVVVLNTKLIRSKFTFDDIIEKVSYKYRIQEQDLMNVLFDDNIKFLDAKYNYYVEVNSWVKDNINNSPVSYKQLYNEAGKCPFIIHYANQPKPWSNPYILLSDKWWQIAKRTPFYEILLLRMSREQSRHISFETVDYYNRILFPFKWLKKVHKRSYLKTIADKLLPYGTKRRKIVKKLLFR